MAVWTRNLQLTEPGPLAQTVAGIDNLASAADATLDATGTVLDAAKLLLAGTVAPEAAAASALIAGVQDLLDDLFGAGFFRIVIHPWIPGVGRSEGVWRHLSFPTCIEHLIRSFDDQGDSARPQFSSLAAVEMVVLVAGGPSPSIFKSTVDALLALIDTKELRLAQRRIVQAFELEDARFTLVKGSTLPDWESITVREALPFLVPVEEALKDALALLAGYAAGAEKAIDALSDLIAAKRAQLTTLQSRLAAAAALFAGGITGADVWKISVSGSGGNDFLKDELRDATDAPGPELSFCVGMAWVGGSGDLQGVKTVFGL